MVTKETETGISFPDTINDMKLVGVGVRVKYFFAKVYAVGMYMESKQVAALKSQSKEDIENALLDPAHPKTFRIVLNRKLSGDTFTSAIVDALEPRMGGEDLFTLDEFRNMNKEVSHLPEGFESLMTIRGGTFTFQNPGVGGKSSFSSEIFCKALCDVYLGADTVSPTLKEAVLDGIINNKQ